MITMITPGNPVIIADEDLADGKLRVILCRNDYHEGHYGIVIADIIRHAALQLAVSEDRIIEAVARELNRPTGTLKQVAGSHAHSV